jgi:hypothetical protein
MVVVRASISETDVRRCPEKSRLFSALIWVLELNRKIFSAHKQMLRVRMWCPVVPPLPHVLGLPLHHSFCGTTTLTPELIVEEFHDHHHADISTLFDHDSLAIMDFEESLNYDVRLLRESPAVPKHIKLYGFFYEISSGKLTEVAQDIPAHQS